MAIVTWIAGGRRRAMGEVPGLARVKSALLVAGAATGAVNATAALVLAREPAVPMESARPSDEVGRMARVQRGGLVSGWAHLLALAGAIGIGAVLADGPRASR